MKKTKLSKRLRPRLVSQRVISHLLQVIVGRFTTNRRSGLGTQTRQCLTIFALWFTFPVLATELSLQQAIDIAIAKDADTARLNFSEQASYQQAVADGFLPDPVIKLGVLNVPTDSFSFDQEPMTQFKVAVAQQFPAGDSLRIRSEQGQLQAESQRRQRQDRSLLIAREVKTLWLDAHYWQQTQVIYQQDHDLFRQLSEVAESFYSVGRGNQQDVLRAELELSQLQDRVLNAVLREQEVRARLSRWLGLDFASSKLVRNHYAPEKSGVNKELTKEGDNQQRILMKHPRLRTIDLEIDMARKKVTLAAQAYKPKWGLEVGYGWRDGNNPNGSERADFLSAGINLQVPLLGTARQDHAVHAARQNHLAMRQKRLDTLNSLLSEVAYESSRKQQYRERLQLYQQQIVPKARQQAEATLSAYQADTAPFADVVRSVLQVQTMQMTVLDIERKLFQAIARLAYLLPEHSEAVRQASSVAYERSHD